MHAEMKQSPGLSEHVLFDFRKSRDVDGWQVVSDSVMGGVSSGQFISGKDGIAEFTGTLSLENKGGFVSLRSPAVSMDLSAYAGLRLRSCGDGRQYRLTIRSQNMQQGVKYQCAIETRADEWATYEIKFADLIPKYRGRILEAANVLDCTAIQSIGLLIADGVSAGFNLRLRSICAW